MKIIQRKPMVVYRFPERVPPQVESRQGVQCSHADEAIIQRLFQQDGERRKRFLSFLQQGYQGFIVHNQQGWINYCWTSTPHSPSPTHLPENVVVPGRYWIFHCRTHEAWRGQGFYAYALQYMAREIRSQAPTADVIIDTEEDNLPARKAMLAAGFVPLGMLLRTHIFLPYLPRVRLAKWRKQTPHPPIPPGK